MLSEECPITTMTWWKKAVIYQIYPRSFQDSDGDGIGDLGGIIQRLKYLTWLGVDAVWISPIYPSPMRDFGYDVTNYTEIDPRFGSLKTFTDLLKQAHMLGLRIILDVVPNHTSDEHPWFIASRQSRRNPYRDWYIWRNPKPNGDPPNNWRGVTGGSAWSFDQATGQYYLHSFLPFEPDLNWRNPKVRSALLDTFRFWLELGVDGLRIDMVDFLIKDARLRDEPNPNYTFATAQYHLNRPEIVNVIRDIRRISDVYSDKVIIGEINPDLSTTQIAAYYGDGDLLHQSFNFGLLKLPFKAAALRRYIRAYEQALPCGAWPNYTLGNHDTPRLASRLSPEEARLAALLLLTLRGAPYLYYGDELGLKNVPISFEQAQDPWEAREPGCGRDPNRTPLPGDNTPEAGFTTGKAWLPVGQENAQRPVISQQGDPDSLLMLYHNLLAIRKRSLALQSGGFKLLGESQDVLMYERILADNRMLVVLNFSEIPQQVKLPNQSSGWQRLLSTRPEAMTEGLGRVILSHDLEGYDQRKID